MPLTKEAAKNLSILSVAEQLGMELKRTGNYSYTWKEHDSFVIDVRKNDFHWNSRSEFGDVIQLVQTIRGVSYKEAMHFLETGEFREVDLVAQTAVKEPFHYSLERYEHSDFNASRSYLRTQRGLSDDTINFFLSQGSMAEATRKKGDYFEPVIVFKYKDNTGFLAGASLQGVVENRVHYSERGRLKQIMKNSDGQLGFSVDIGKPKRLVFAEAPIDLMSYYEFHKDNLQDVRLVAMDGVKEGIISRRFMELYAEMNGKAYQVDQNTGKALETVVNTTDYFKDGQHQDMITLAVDNDAAGHNFITRLQEKGIPVQIAIPPILQPDQEKEDWNDFLKRGNEAPNELVHVYSADEESWHYQGYFSKEIALAKAQELTEDDVKAFVSAKQLTKEEVHQEYTRIIDQEKERGSSMSEVHEARADYKSEGLEAIQDKVDGLVIQPETQALIDSGEVKRWAKQPNIYFVKGLRRVALELTKEGRFELSPKYRPNTDEEKEIVNKLLSNQKKREDEIHKSALAPDTSNLSPEDAEWLKQNWDNISFSVEPKKQMVIDSDKTVTFEKPSNPLGDSSRALEENQSTEKALGKSQEQNVNSEYQKNERTNGSQGSLQPKAEGSPTPVPEVGTFERSVTSRPTLSSHLLYFSINEEFQSSNDGHYHSISSHELAKLNRPIRSQTIQNAAQYYLDELANSKVYYVTPDKTVQVNFEEKHFMHLTGIKPIGPGQTPEKTLRDFAEGNGRFDNILLANNDAAFDKLKVLSDLSVATESTSFYFDDLTDLRRYNGRFDSLIKSDDKDIILLFKELEEDNYIPVSVFQSRTKLVKELETVDRIPILGVYRERDGHIERLSINEALIADGGKEMMENLQRREFEETNSKEEMIQDNPERTLPSPDEKIRQHNRKDEMDRDLDGDGISNSDEMLQGTDPYNAASNLHKKQEERERRIDAEVVAGAIITEAVATKNSERSISQMVAEKDTKALAEHLKEGMKNYLDSDQFKSFLDTMSKFHNYSLNNIHLLKMQNPNVTQVASFNKWKTDFDRTVKKGAKALKIWVPYQVKTKIPENQKELNFSPSENEMDQKEITVTRFKLGNVFDVSQTEGKELPKAIHELTGSVKDYEDLYRAAKAVSMDNQVPISFEEIKRESTNGYYSPDENRIVISKKLKGEEHILKTIFHEMAHADLHKGTNAQYGDDQYRKQELQAESVAYVVASHFGFDTSSYSFGYLAIWAKDKNGFEDMMEQLQVVQKEAKSLIDRMDAKLELVKNKTVVKDKFADKLQQAKEQSEKLSNQKAEAVKQVEEKKSLSSPH
ncbi:PBECR4 domain-containing protein [Streptococcus cristatus]|uniref:PBECR4 domain-containing protein n=1 Tax=Streptococcus cristatus TaxID=45634 RepID=A0AAW5WL97_STRCR|nr:PBECR4 domain-containing protein [Streptococcus cristatus]MCY7220938.1 PBECR4 domain-containing protein [Streptococcus cristatus]